LQILGRFNAPALHICFLSLAISSHGSQAMGAADYPLFPGEELVSFFSMKGVSRGEEKLSFYTITAFKGGCLKY